MRTTLRLKLRDYAPQRAFQNLTEQVLSLPAELHDSVLGSLLTAATGRPPEEKGCLRWRSNRSVFHAASSPTLERLEKCRSDAESTNEVLFFTFGAQVYRTTRMLNQINLMDRIEVWDVSTYLSLTSWLRGGFDGKMSRIELEHLVFRYNRSISTGLEISVG